MEVGLLDLEGLTNEERTIILNVIRRDDEVCRRLETRIKQLKAELHDIRMKSALRTGDDLSKMCARCHMIFGIFVNTGDICPGCHFRVCKNCRENLISHGWMCILCFRENQIRWLTGEWMGKDKTGKSKQIRATDLVRASLRIRHENRSLGGLEDRTGHGSSSSDSSSRHTARVEYPQESDKRRLSSLLESLRSGFGAGTQDGVASATVGSTAGGEMVVQHVSCRRRRDSNSSSDSEPSCQTRETSGARKSRSSGSETLAVGKKASPRHGQGDPESALTTRVSSASRLAPESPDLEVMSSRREGQARRSADPVLDGGRRHAQSETWAGVEDGRDRKEVRRRVLPQPHLAAAAAVAAADARSKSGDARSPSHLHDRPEERLLLPAPVTPSGDDDHSSGCSFTSSEWGEVTPTSPSADTPSRRHGHSGLEGHVERRDQSSGDHSSGYLSFPKRSGENSHFPNEHFTKASHNPPRSSSSEITVSESRPHTGEGRLEVPVMQVHVQPAQEDPHGAKLNRSPAEQHVRRHSSGRSDASLASARTASPATKLRLLDLASQRALDRDGDSLASWSGGSEDTLSLGMSCTGLRGSPEVAQSLAAPTGRRPAPKPPGPSQGNVPDGAESQQKLPPDISISRPVDADSAGSEHSGSPEKRSSPHRNSHLSIPSAATGSQSGSHDERSFDDDDDNIDELFANHRSGSRLSAMRNNIGDSRESLASVYSNAGEINYGRIPVTGDIVFGLDYDHRHSVLKIDVRNCQNIAPVDTKHNRSDPYVKVYLLPDKTRSGKRKTKIKKHTLNPVFNEVLTYNISRGELENRTLWVTVWHSDRFGRNDFLGEVLIAMDTYRFDDPSPCAYSLQSRAQESVGEAMQYKGELSLSLMYVTPEKVAAASQKSKSKLKKSKSAAEPMGEIHVMIKSASNLTAVRSNGTSDPFVKGYLLPDRARNGKQKTPVVKNTVNPSWSHILVFDGITPEEIPERSLELTVWDHEKLGTNEFLGGVRLNTGLGVAKGLQVDWMDARGEEAMAWQAIMERHNVWIDARLPLRASMGKPSKK